MVNRQVQIGESLVGTGLAPYVIAEAGVNHNGDPTVAHQLIDAAADVGADAVKFQTFAPDELVRPGSAAAEYQQMRTGEVDQHKMLEKLSLPQDAWADLVTHAKRRSIDFLSTPFDHRSLYRLVELGVPAIKLSSGDLTNHDFLRAARETGLPIILSTGASFLEEVSLALDVLGRSDDVVLLHCVTAYPAPTDEVNLRSIAGLIGLSDGPVGWSDHTIGSDAAVVARALGAAVFEKHLTLDSGMPGPDHAASTEPDGFHAYVAALRRTDVMLGDGVKRPQASELANRQLARRGLYAARELTAGQVLSTADLIALRPEVHAPASTPYQGRVLKRDLAVGEAIMTSDIESGS